MKSPRHEIPSGDRELAAGVLAALSMNSMHARVDLVSELRCYDGEGSISNQQALLAAAEAEIRRLLNDEQRHDWRAWVSYHNYYKAPDLIGPRVCQVLDIPYVLIEASRSKRQLDGPWSDFAARAEAACDQAALIFYVTDRDRVALEQYRHKRQKVIHFAPFLNRLELPGVAHRSGPGGGLLAVGMHREGDKLASYRIIAALLPHLTTADWSLAIAGDGPAHAQVRSLFASFGERVRFLGQLDRQLLNRTYACADVFVWPGVNEAFGMVYLEAQAAGLAVVAQDRPGVREVLASKQSLVPVGSPAAMARVVDALLASDSTRAAMMSEAQRFVRERHLLGSAAATLSQHLQPLILS